MNQSAQARVDEWMALAIHGASPDTRLFAKLVSAREVRGETSLLGLSDAQYDALIARHFIGPLANDTPQARPLLTPEHVSFVESMHALLMNEASASPDVNADDAAALASIIAHACLRPDHLWRDLGLSGRDDVTWMLGRYFPALAARNTQNLRWKKFLAQQRAFALGIEPGPAPGCPGCEDYGFCFPERAGT